MEHEQQANPFDINITAKDFDPERELAKIRHGAYLLALSELADLALYTQARTFMAGADNCIRQLRSEIKEVRKIYANTGEAIERAKVQVREVDEGTLAVAGLTRDQAKELAASLRRKLAKCNDELKEKERIVNNWEAFFACLKRIERPTTPHLKKILKTIR